MGANDSPETLAIATAAALEVQTPDWSNDQYHSDRTAVSSSVLKQILRSPAHMKAYIEAPNKETPGRIIGTALHAAVLEPEKFASEFVIWDGDRRGAKYTAFEAENAGKSILKPQEMEDVLGMANAIMEYPYYPIGELLREGINEKSIIWTDPETGVRCKIRPDNINEYCMMDLKTTDDAREKAFARQCEKLRYDFQAGMYTEGYRNARGAELDFYFIAVEDTKPYGVYVHQASPEMIAEGVADFRKALNMYKKCLETGEYPGYENPFSVMTLPKWGKKK